MFSLLRCFGAPVEANSAECSPVKHSGLSRVRTRTVTDRGFEMAPRKGHVTPARSTIYTLPPVSRLDDVRFAQNILSDIKEANQPRIASLTACVAQGIRLDLDKVGKQEFELLLNG